jgi:sugar phosphate isomerase/epimerase
VRYRLGAVDVVFWSEPDLVRRAERARDLGFEHIDPSGDVDEATFPLPIGCPTSFPKPRPGWCSTPAPLDAPGMWERTVRWFARAPGALLEPHAGATVCSLETARQMMREVPGLRLLVDTGHVANWGGDPLELLEYADHVQLRQGRAGSTQVHPDDPSGVVDFAALLRRLDDLDYRGCLSIEYFDLPEHGWPLDDPVGHAVALRAQVLALMGA